MTKVLVINEERSIRNTLKERLEHEGLRVDVAENEAEAHEKCQKTIFDIILSDLFLLTPVRGVRPLLELIPYSVKLIVVSSVQSVEMAVDCMREGAFDYLPKPIDMNRLLSSIKKAQLSSIQPHAAAEVVVSHPKSDAMSAAESAEETSKRIRARSSHAEQVEEIIGQSEAIGLVKKIIAKIAPYEARVLITGANGTGKELVARWLHEKSGRRSGPFVEVNCAAIPADLIESELFGHEKGAFTSAIKQRKGKFEQADGGTLFLDEIGDMSLAAQAKMLRALQERRISRVGSDRDITVNVRVLAATNKDLRKEIEIGNFREDLYHRLSVIVLRVPTLNARRDDIPLLIDHFVKKVSYNEGIAPKKIEADAMARLESLDWRGNVRELGNVVERLMLLSEKTITLKDVNTHVTEVY